MNRRTFLEVGALSSALFVSGASARAGRLANDEIAIACLGTGGRCRWLMERLAKIEGTRLVAVCDVYNEALAQGAKLADAKALQESDYQKLLDRSDVDAVLIGSPDHWHVPMTVDACNAGKDVYVEKPLTHSIKEGERVIAAQNDNSRIVQVGTQHRSMPHLNEARDIVRSGGIGEVYKVRMTWNRGSRRWKRWDYGIQSSDVDWKAFLGSAPDQPFDQYKMENWRFFWDFGGGIFTDLMVHWLDTAYWFLDMQDPSTAASIGDQFASKGLWETPDTVQTLLHYPDDKLQAHFEGTFVNWRDRAMIEFMGSEATLYCDRGRYEVIPEHKSKAEARSRVDGDGAKGADFYNKVDGAQYHLQNWVDCMRSRETPNCPAEAGVRSAKGAHLANKSLRENAIARPNS
ncbi:Gfo/Idh/MocA family protein [Stratiformator vulcanicus]|uniref:Inositol 2-dehydrogenase n=1 Tax=Stratiformator vulcanicus TaxID=2527980 RepID=A0A517R262_9PLAN|nr:Gfo/Idh/MocA family oxidoreductase [Stratiformator vulcanicus]QDT37933.1 Inositol 2-dehydrogenase [Stratiformator vulcanicus]